MVDIKKIKKELLAAFSNAEPPQERIVRDTPLDSALSQFFNKASHMPKELTFEAVINSLAAEKTEKPVDRKQVREILDRYL